jgi:hypothetical protein
MGRAVTDTIIVRCLRCEHKAVISEISLKRFGLRPGTPIANFVKRLRCQKFGSGSVLVRRSKSKDAVA